MNIFFKVALAPTLLLFILLPIFAQSPAVIQQLSQVESQRELKRVFKTISLSSVLSQGLSKNYSEQIRGTQKKIELLKWNNLKDSFWLPNISLSLNTSKQRLGTLKKGLNNNYNKDPYGTLSLSLGEYTIFNWGKDYLKYKNNLSTISRSQESLAEQRRDLKHRLFVEYFNLVTLKRLANSRRNLLRQASFIYRFSRERIGLRKIAKHDFMSARDSYLQAQADFYEVKKRVQVASENIAFLIKDPVGTSYVIDEEINFRKLTMPMSEALMIAHKHSKYLKQSKYELQNAKRSYTIAIRDNLPLPKITLDLGAYQHAFGNGLRTTHYKNGNGNSLELVASVNATWTILGSGGPFNKRARLSKLLEFNQTQINHQRYGHYIDSQVKNYYTKIKSSEKLYLIYKVKLDNLNRTFDYIIDRYMSNKISFLYFKTYLNELKQTETSFYSILYNHLKDKVELAKLMGVDEFPGERFSQLAVRIIK